MDSKSTKPEKHICIICEQLKFEGIHLYTSFVCRDCEKEIIQTDTSDSKYKYYLQQLRKISKPQIYN
ncbi:MULTISPECIES: sigma factor G inhibitor Gin [Bacillus]|uniref:sigma factor G inhibitor Gin n=1 Tax=Bacillus TaxID=1386 RepID=UPI00037C01D0|nr:MULTISPECIES: sigma factor G inhibitor Gin [Bacillus]